MKKTIAVLILALLAAVAAWAGYASVELEREAEREVGYLGKVAEIAGDGAVVEQLRTTWTNTAEVVTSVTTVGTNEVTTVTTVTTNYYRSVAGETTNTLAVGDFVLPNDRLREAGGITLTTVILEM